MKNKLGDLKFFLWGLVILTNSAICSASEIPEKSAVYKLGEIVVTPTKTKEKISDIPNHVEVITRDEIENYRETTGADIVGKRITGHYHNYGGLLKPIGLRGFQTETHGDDIKGRVLILVDGHRIGTGNLAKISPDMVERIEVIKGPASALYDAAAMGGVINIITRKGEGKGKTTAAIGLAWRAREHNLKVCYIYFHKNPDKWKSGKHETLQKLGVDVFGFAKKHPHFFREIDLSEGRKECLKGLEFIRKIYKKKEYNILILDEIKISLRDRFLKEKEILDILDLKPEDLDLILTGRGVSNKIIERADLVSEIKNIKHHYDKEGQRKKGLNIKNGKVSFF